MSRADLDRVVHVHQLHQQGRQALDAREQLALGAQAAGRRRADLVLVLAGVDRDQLQADFLAGAGRDLPRNQTTVRDTKSCRPPSLAPTTLKPGGI